MQETSLSLHLRQRSLINFSPFSSPVNSPLIGGKFFSRLSPVSRKSPSSPQGSSSSHGNTPLSSPCTPCCESRKIYGSADMSITKKCSDKEKTDSDSDTSGRKSPTARSHERAADFPPVSPLLCTPTLSGVEMYTIFEEEGNSLSRTNSSDYSQVGSWKTDNLEKYVSVNEMEEFSRKQMKRQNAVVSLDDDEPSPSDNSNNNCNSRRNGTPTQQISQNATSPLQYTTADNLPSPASHERVSLFERPRRAAVTDTSTPDQSDIHHGFKATEQLTVDDNSKQEEESNSGDILSQSLPESLLFSSLSRHSAPSSPSPISPSPIDVHRQLGHHRKRSLPIHIQRAFPDMTPMRAQSPLVLHELRSSPTTESPQKYPVPQLQKSVSEPAKAEAENASSEDEERTVLCGKISLSALISPVSSPKRTIAKRKKATPASMSPTASPSRGRKHSEQSISTNAAVDHHDTQTPSHPVGFSPPPKPAHTASNSMKMTRSMTAETITPVASKGG